MRKWILLLLSLAALVLLALRHAHSGGSPEGPAPEKEPAADARAEGEKNKKSDVEEMFVHSVSREVHSESPVVVLATGDKSRFLLVFIGPNEAAAILRETLRTSAELPPPPRPMTHDLLKDTITQMGGKLVKITITKIENGIFFAELAIDMNSSIVVIDARPSDSMALAVRFKAPIFVTKQVLDEAGQSSPPLSEREEGPKGEEKPSVPADAI